jgi:quinol monooxygenase YgiN
MPTELLTVVAEMSAKPGQEDALRSVLLGLVAPTKKEDGCVQYDLHVSTDEPGRFVFYENWTSREALDRHLATPHLKAFVARADELLAQPPRILTYTLISA